MVGLGPAAGLALDGPPANLLLASNDSPVVGVGVSGDFKPPLPLRPISGVEIRRILDNLGKALPGLAAAVVILASGGGLIESFPGVGVALGDRASAPTLDVNVDVGTVVDAPLILEEEGTGGWFVASGDFRRAGVFAS